MRYPKPKSSRRREKIAFLSLAAFVLTVMTMAGVYLRERNKLKDEYQIDLAKLDGQSKNLSSLDGMESQTDPLSFSYEGSTQEILSNDLDVDPNSWETGSTDVIAQITGITANAPENVTSEKVLKEDEDKTANVTDEDSGNQAGNNASNGGSGQNTQDGVAASTNAVVSYTFCKDKILNAPVAGAVIIPFSMEKPVYYKTLNQYRCSDAIVLSATEGENVLTPATGVVKQVFRSAELGTGVIIEIGDGYELTFAQLKDLLVKEGDVIAKGDVIGCVSEPTAFYSVEGCNLYMKLTYKEEAIDPTAEIK